jgi:hypothetical protein
MTQDVTPRREQQVVSPNWGVTACKKEYFCSNIRSNQVTSRALYFMGTSFGKIGNGSGIRENRSVDQITLLGICPLGNTVTQRPFSPIRAHLPAIILPRPASTSRPNSMRSHAATACLINGGVTSGVGVRCVAGSCLGQLSVSATLATPR